MKILATLVTTLLLAPAPPGGFTLTAPVDGATDVPLVPALTWGASSGATSYTLEVATDAAFTTIVLTQVGIASTSYSPGAPVAQGVTFYWRVTAVNGSGNTVATGAPFSFTTVVLPPAAFTVNAPAAGATGVALTPTFDWNASTGADTYTLEVSTDPGFSTLDVSQSGLVGTTFSPGAPLVGGTNYYWRVKAINAGGSTTATGAPFGFQTLSTGPGAFTLVYPPDQASNVDPNTFFIWNDATGVTTYTLDLATDAAFSSLVFEVTGIPGSSFASTLNLTLGTTYYWRVTALNGSGTTMASNGPFVFQTSDLSASSGNVGFSGSSGGGCGLLGLELLLPCALCFARRKLRKG